MCLSVQVCLQRKLWKGQFMGLGVCLHVSVLTHMLINTCTHKRARTHTSARLEGPPCTLARPTDKQACSHLSASHHGNRVPPLLSQLSLILTVITLFLLLSCLVVCPGFKTIASFKANVTPPTSSPCQKNGKPKKNLLYCYM